MDLIETSRATTDAEAAHLDAQAAEMTAAEQETDRLAALRRLPAGAYAPDFLRMLKNAVHFACHDDSAPLLHAVRIVWRDKRVYAQATDRYRLYSEWVAMRPATAQDEMLAEGEALVPLDQIRKLIKRLAGCDRSERVELALHGGKLVVATVEYGRERLDITATYPLPLLDSDFINVERFLGSVDWTSDQQVPPRYSFNKGFFEQVLKVDSGTRGAPITLNFAAGPTKPIGFRMNNGDDGGIEGVLMPIRQAA